MAVVDGKTTENYALLPKSDPLTPENHTALNDTLMVKHKVGTL